MEEKIMKMTAKQYDRLVKIIIQALPICFDELVVRSAEKADMSCVISGMLRSLVRSFHITINYAEKITNKDLEEVFQCQYQREKISEIDFQTSRKDSSKIEMSFFYFERIDNGEITTRNVLSQIKKLGRGYRPANRWELMAYIKLREGVTNIKCPEGDYECFSEIIELGSAPKKCLVYAYKKRAHIDGWLLPTEKYLYHEEAQTNWDNRCVFAVVYDKDLAIKQLCTPKK